MPDRVPLDYAPPQARNRRGGSAVVWLVYVPSVLVGFLLEDVVHRWLMGRSGDQGIFFCNVLGAGLNAFLLLVLQTLGVLRRLRLGFRLSVAMLAGILVFPVGLGAVYVMQLFLNF